jgi:hypothetical protein
MFEKPLLFAATLDGFGISVVLSSGDPSVLRARVRPEDATSFGELEEPVVRAADVAEWRLGGLSPSTRYVYQILDVSGETPMPLHQGSVITARPPGESFTFALLSDSHIGAHLEYGNQGDEVVLAAVGQAIESTRPDFFVNLGDMLDFHEYGFNAPPPGGDVTRLAYLNYRMSIAGAAANAAHYPVIGNWEGENGEYTPEQIAWSREARMRYMPGPDPETYPEGGSTGQDYYAFTWGDVLFVVLNVMTYTPTAHLLRSTDRADDWTLGADQLEFLRQTLENATTSWRFLLIHHAVGGKAGDPANSGYGRGGGQAADVGEQAIVHQLMLDHGAQAFFYGHDHVFTDMVVDGIHYTAPGSAGAPWMFSQAETGYAQSWLESGWGRVDVTPDSVHVTFLGMNGDVIYEYTID